MKETIQMLKTLTEAKGIAGREDQVRTLFNGYISPFADEIMQDGLGSLIAKKQGTKTGPKIMITGHLDEVGFMVTQVDEHGFIKFQPIGGWVPHVMLSQKVTIVTRSHAEIIGVIGSKPPHIMTLSEREKTVAIQDMFIDIGVSSQKEALDAGIRPGDMIVPVCDFTVMHNEKYLLAKAWDNRIGLAVIIEVLKALQKEEHPNIVYGVGAVQEEVGLRGSKTATHLVQPDIGFALDVGIAGDTPGISANLAQSKIGLGPQIVIYDASMVSHPGLRDLVTDIADELRIPYQFEAIPKGGTDAGSIHLTGNGVPSLPITIATRYIHSHTSILHYDDFINTVKLTTEVIKRLDQEKVEQLVMRR
ncbi:M42 family metallopeptidase [Listeria sp. PSOL-1]|uniref:M42 family metallopeptidase n=1 Tax=Listeria sp. PSOL-1 TaxID=1844999 RepID=UPI0013D2005D|nr:M42 family metallopeptidase [Listeria sp. PSOL-1]